MRRERRDWKAPNDEFGSGAAATERAQLLLTIARAVDETGSCRSVTQDDRAASCGCTVRPVRRLVKELAEARYLAHRRRGRRGGGRAADLYVLPREAREATSGQMSGLVESSGKPDMVLSAGSG